MAAIQKLVEGGTWYLGLELAQLGDNPDGQLLEDKGFDPFEELLPGHPTPSASRLETDPWRWVSAATRS